LLLAGAAACCGSFEKKQTHKDLKAFFLIFHFKKAAQSERPADPLRRLRSRAQRVPLLGLRARVRACARAVWWCCLLLRLKRKRKQTHKDLKAFF
jgi:hypothetical protein